MPEPTTPPDSVPASNSPAELKADLTATLAKLRAALVRDPLGCLVVATAAAEELAGAIRAAAEKIAPPAVHDEGSKSGGGDGLATTSSATVAPFRLPTPAEEYLSRLLQMPHEDWRALSILVRSDRGEEKFGGPWVGRHDPLKPRSPSACPPGSFNRRASHETPPSANASP